MKLTKSGLAIPDPNRKAAIDQWGIPGFWHVLFVRSGISGGFNMHQLSIFRPPGYSSACPRGIASRLQGVLISKRLQDINTLYCILCAARQGQVGMSELSSQLDDDLLALDRRYTEGSSHTNRHHCIRHGDQCGKVILSFTLHRSRPSPGAFLRPDSADVGTVVTPEQRSSTSRSVKYLIF